MLFYHLAETVSMESPPKGRPPSTLTQDAERNKLLAEMAEQSTDMISRHTPDDWRFIYASPAVENLLGYTVDEIVGVSAYELYHPDDVEDFKRRAPSVSYERGTYTHTYRFRCKDGHYTWLESTSRSLRDPETGELKEMLVVSRDASRRINAEMTNRRLAKVLESSSDLVAFVDLDERVSNLNEAARVRLETGESNSAILLADLFFSESDQRMIQEAMAKAREIGDWQGEVDMCTMSGDKIPVILEVQAHRTYDDRIEYFSIVARDMSLQKAIEAERQQYQDEVSRASRIMTMGEMASGLAHELNQPLTAIVNYVSGIERRLNKQDQIETAILKKPLKKISATALRAGEIIHRMMDFARKGQPQRKAIELSQLVDDVIGFCADNASRQQVRIENRIQYPELQVEADRIQLEQVLLNLFLNAIEATSQSVKGEPEVIWVDVAEAEHQQVIIRVHDQGPGLPVSDDSQLFEQFFTTKEHGLGMGLAISRSLIEAHGGHLWAENASEGGAVFSFSLNRSEGGGR